MGKRNSLEPWPSYQCSQAFPLHTKALKYAIYARYHIHCRHKVWVQDHCLSPIKASWSQTMTEIVSPCLRPAWNIKSRFEPIMVWDQYSVLILLFSRTEPYLNGVPWVNRLPVISSLVSVCASIWMRPTLPYFSCNVIVLIQFGKNHKYFIQRDIRHKASFLFLTFISYNV